MGFLAPKMPSPIPPPSPATPASSNVQASAAQLAAEAAASEGHGFAGTEETGGQGAPSPQLAGKSLLGG